jgi:hypothetical protein
MPRNSEVLVHLKNIKSPDLAILRKIYLAGKEGLPDLFLCGDHPWTITEMKLLIRS